MLLAAYAALRRHPAALALLREESGPGLGHLAQGSVFAAKARHHAGFVPGHTEAAVGAFTGLSAEAAARLADDCAPAVVRDAGVPAYEVWRTRVRERLAVIPAVEHV